MKVTKEQEDKIKRFVERHTGLDLDRVWTDNFYYRLDFENIYYNCDTLIAMGEMVKLVFGNPKDFSHRLPKFHGLEGGSISLALDKKEYERLLSYCI